MTIKFGMQEMILNDFEHMEFNLRSVKYDCK